MADTLGAIAAWLGYIAFCGMLSVIAARDLEREYGINPIKTMICAAVVWILVAAAGHRLAQSDRDCAETVGRGSISCE